MILFGKFLYKYAYPMYKLIECAIAECAYWLILIMVYTIRFTQDCDDPLEEYVLANQCYI